LFRIVRKPQRSGLAAELLESLFCGLPRLARRMAVFVAAGDESDGAKQDGYFLYGGFVAPIRDWIDWFVPAWEERVLNPKPRIPYLHMVEMRSSSWRKDFGLTESQAERRIDEAARVICSMGSLQLLTTWIDGGHFRSVFKGARIAKKGPQVGAYSFDPDYIGFLGFAYNGIEYVAEHYPDAEKVDFVVERKKTVSHYVPNYLGMLKEFMDKQGRADLVKLIGEVTFGEKERVPLQAADMAMWHIRRARSGESDSQDQRRLKLMFDGRPHTFNEVPTDGVEAIARRAHERFNRGGAV
jgi:hypothetical protein